MELRPYNELAFEEFNPPYRDKQIGNDIVIML